VCVTIAEIISIFSTTCFLGRETEEVLIAERIKHFLYDNIIRYKRDIYSSEIFM